MEDIYLVQCINCKHRDFIQEYEGDDFVDYWNGRRCS